MGSPGFSRVTDFDLQLSAPEGRMRPRTDKPKDQEPARTIPHLARTRTFFGRDGPYLRLPSASRGTTSIRVKSMMKWSPSNFTTFPMRSGRTSKLRVVRPLF